MVKTCPNCGLPKDTSEFSLRSDGRPSAWCKECGSKAGSERYWSDPEAARRKNRASYQKHRRAILLREKERLAKDPEKFREAVRQRRLLRPDVVKKYVLNKKYGLSLEDWDRMFDEQDGCCAICKKKTAKYGKDGLYVDHDHTTGKVRALLCPMCNKGIGFLKDSELIIRAASEYISKHSPGS